MQDGATKTKIPKELYANELQITDDNKWLFKIWFETSLWSSLLSYVIWKVPKNQKLQLGMSIQMAVLGKWTLVTH
jgi:hypothetical protein